MSEAWYDIPEELRFTPQWCIAGPDDSGRMKVPHTIHGYRAKSTDPSMWSHFEEAVEAAEARGWGIGFMLSSKDPYSCIDLDVKDADNCDTPEKHTTPEQMARFGAIVMNLDSYTEVSQSGKGAHIWVRGKIGLGRRRDGVEIYSQERFIVCTGNVYKDIPINERQEFVTKMASQMGVIEEYFDAWVDESQVMTDHEVCDRLSAQENGQKFRTLFAGDWQSFGFYPSQSEADFALMSMFAFISNNNEQCVRLFRMSGLGKRDKAMKNDSYLTRRCLNPIRQRIMNDRRTIEHGAALAAAIMRGAQGIVESINSGDVDLIHPPEPISEEEFIPPPELPPETLPWPPGAAGHLAYSMYINSQRPIPEIAIISTLGLLAGISGRRFQISNTGLNNYFVLVGKSAIGKEALHSNLSKIVHEMQGHVPAIVRYVDFTSYASGQALSKAISEQPCFLNVSGEWGRKLKRLANEDGRDGPMQSLRTALTDLYQKSATNTIVGGIGYSDKEKNIAAISGVGYSMIGESTPSTYNETLTDAMMEDGFLSRFVTISYQGDRPKSNKAPRTQTPNDCLSRLAKMIGRAEDDNQRDVNVECTAEAAAKLDEFDLECDSRIEQNPDDDGWRQMWNRAHIKVLRIAATIAVFENVNCPVVTLDQVEWALIVIRRDIAIMAQQIDAGDIGTGDVQREKKLLSCCQDYRAAKKIPSGYRIDPKMHKAGVVTRQYMSQRVQRVASFTSHKLGFANALENTIKSMCANGLLKEVPADKAVKDFEFGGKCYYILAPRK